VAYFRSWASIRCSQRSTRECASSPRTNLVTK
jgi:hypothetical protein